MLFNEDDFLQLVILRQKDKIVLPIRSASKKTFLANYSVNGFLGADFYNPFRSEYSNNEITNNLKTTI